jgi:anti-anti-sigma factor
MLVIETEKIKEILVFKLEGRLDGVTSKLFMDKSSAPELAEYSKIVVNCEALAYISSEGLRVLLMLAKKTKSLSGGLTLCNLNPSVNEVMEISGFSELLGVHDSVDKAVFSLL